MSPSRFAAIAAIIPAVLAPNAWAQEGRTPALSRVVECRSIREDAARLACYDAQVGALDAAEHDKQVVVMDREQIRRTRRSLFGLTLPSLSFLGGGDKDKAAQEEAATLETTIARASRGPDGKWVLVLADGARWRQSDTRDIPRDPRAGMPIVIRRAALGSYLGKIDGQIAVRMERVN